VPDLQAIKGKLASLLPVGLRSYLAARSGAHRGFVGPRDEFDISGASQFNLLTLLGLREHHYVLDVGCGSLRAGRLLITYLQPGRYYGIEPDPWLIESVVRGEIGRELIRLKRPVFDQNDAFRLSVFEQTFDFVLASSIFSHAAEAQIRTCLSEACKVMQSESLMLASFVPGTTNHDGNRWTYPGTVTYTMERMRDLAAEQKLVCETIDWPYVYGTGRQTWLALSLAG
jgi:SAM-dependent methyltransferase